MKHFFAYIIFCGLLGYDVEAQQIIFSEDFENRPISQAWSVSPGKDHGRVEIVAPSQSSKNHVVRLGKSTDGKLDVNRLDLAVDLSGYSQVALQFDLYHYHEETHPQDGIYLSVDGGRFFVKIFSFAFDQWAPRTTGTMPPLDLNYLAAKKRVKLSHNSVIRFQQYGSNDFNGSAQHSDGLQLDNIRLFVPEISYVRPPFRETFEEAYWSSALSIGNTLTTDPDFVPSPFGVVEVVPFGDQQGRVLRMGSSLDGQPATNALDLHVDLSTQVDVDLTFKLLNNFDETHPQDGIYFSSDAGKQFIKVFDFDLELWREKVFGQYPPINIAQLARQHRIPLTSTFVIRFQQHDDSDFEGSRLSSDGIYLDDIELRETTISFASLPFLEDFEAGTLGSYWRHGTPDRSDSSVVVTPTGQIKIITTPEGNAVRLGNTVDRLYTTNALDLYLDLSHAENPELSFQILNHFDETHPQDGIYFSQNAGVSFAKVFDFDGDNWANLVWGGFQSIDIRQLASRHHLKLTSQFVIRFQQHDNDDFEGTRTISDGIYLDNIRVEEHSCQYYTSLPFVETFESDTLSKYWRIGNLSQTVSRPLVRPGSSALVIDTFGYSQPRSLAIGRLNNGKLTGSALDLHLDLSYQTNLRLDFWMYNQSLDLRPENGIWISDDGGKNFTQAYPFQPSVTRKYINYRIDLDSLVRAVALNYTNQFVIRFQQLGDRSFLGEGNFCSGIFLDDITLTHRDSSPSVQDSRLNYSRDSQQPQNRYSSGNSAKPYLSRPLPQEKHPEQRGSRTLSENFTSYSDHKLIAEQ